MDFDQAWAVVDQRRAGKRGKDDLILDAGLAGQTGAKRRAGGTRAPVEEKARARCQICLEYVSLHEAARLGRCGHTFCLDCLQCHFAHSIADRRLPLGCPLPCGASVALSAARWLLGEPARRQLDELQAQLLVPEECHFWCPHPGCGALLELGADLVLGCPQDCPACGRPVCSSCRSRWHTGLSCEQFQRLAPPSDVMLLSQQRGANQRSRHHPSSLPTAAWADVADCCSGAGESMSSRGSPCGSGSPMGSPMTLEQPQQEQEQNEQPCTLSSLPYGSPFIAVVSPRQAAAMQRRQQRSPRLMGMQAGWQQPAGGSAASGAALQDAAAASKAFYSWQTSSWH